jgi:hypothetical protein
MAPIPRQPRLGHNVVVLKYVGFNDMGMTGTLGAVLSTAIWGFIAGAGLAWTADALLGKAGRPVSLLWVVDLAIIGLIVMVPQGIRLWGPRAFVQRYLPHTLTVAELSLLVKIAVVAGSLGVALAVVLCHRAQLHTRGGAGANESN